MPGDHDVQIHAMDGLTAPFPYSPSAAFLRLLCSCGEQLGDFYEVRPGEAWRLEQAHRNAIASAPRPVIHYGDT